MKSLKRLMKSETQVRAICKRETEKYLSEEYTKIYNDGAYASIATTFYLLSHDFGFGGRRLKKLKKLIEEENLLMNVGVLGKKYDALDVMEHLKTRYGIDLKASCFEEVKKLDSK